MVEFDESRPFCKAVKRKLSNKTEEDSIRKEEDLRELDGLYWDVIILKFAYYYPAIVKDEFKHLTVVPDSVYDAKEVRYQQLCLKYGYEPVATDMVEFDDATHNCMMVKMRLSR